MINNSYNTVLQNTNSLQAIDGKSAPEDIIQKAKEFEEVFIADFLKNAKIGMADSSLVSDTKITDTFSTFMNKALSEIIMSQGGFGLAQHVTNSLVKERYDSPIITTNNPKE